MSKWAIVKRVLLSLGILIVAFIFYVLFVPVSINPALKANRPSIEKVPDPENAWTEYNLAGKDLGDFDQQQKEQIFQIDETVRGEQPLDDKQKAYLEKHRAALEHLVAGAKLPKAQFYAEAPLADSPAPALIQGRNLINLATLEARRLVAEGKVKEAVALDLAALKMGTDHYEPNSTLISALCGVVFRSLAINGLATIIYEGKTDGATDAEIARRIGELNNRLPDPFKVIQWEWEMTDRAFEDMLLGDKLNSEMGKKVGYMPKALRQRIYIGYMKQHTSLLASMRNNLETWNFKAAQADSLKIEEAASNWYKHFSVGDMFGSIMVGIAVPSASASMKSLYGDRINGMMLQAFAACSAYKKAHGKFPETLDMAFTELGLPVPIDPPTQKPIGYRLEGDKPVIWFAGVDGVDDGGKQPYTAMNRSSITPGHDVIFNYGETPFWSRKGY